MDWDGNGSVDPCSTLTSFYSSYGPTTSITGRDGSDVGTVYFIADAAMPGDSKRGYFEVTVDMSLYYMDCNGNTVADNEDIALGTSLDCNGDGIPDECDIASGTSLDCNENGIPNECDISTGTSLDCNSDGIPDECESVVIPNLDFNLDGIVNLRDFGVMAAAWLTDADQTDVAPCGGDDTTDILDLTELAGHWLEPVDYFPDTCQYAQEVIVGALYEGTTVGATATDGMNDITSCGYNDFNDVWLYFAANQADLYRLDLQGVGDFEGYPVLSAWES